MWVADKPTKSILVMDFQLGLIWSFSFIVRDWIGPYPLKLLLYTFFSKIYIGYNKNGRTKRKHPKLLDKVFVTY